MKMYYYRGPRPNFGDELNVWLWPRLLPGFFDADERVVFLGIGSTLYDFLPKTARKIVFGAGYAGYTPPPAIDDRWTFYFVRGRLTTDTLGLDRALAVGDGAILVRSCVTERPSKIYPSSFMPHWESARDGHWAEATHAAGLHYIDPCGPVETVLADILRSEVVVTEAMHGAIVSDALRVPWVPVRPVQPAHRSKWFDWASALDIDLEFGRGVPSNALEWAMSFTADKQRKRWLRARGQRLRGLASGVFKDRAARTLSALARRNASLSDDAAMSRAHARMLEHLDRLKQDVARGMFALGPRAEASADTGAVNEPTVSPASSCSSC